MRTLKTALLATTFLVGAASYASAADVHDRGGSYKDEPAAYMPAITWTGFYAGIHAGSTFNDELELTLDIDDIGSASAEGEVDEAFIGGVHVGYNWQSSNIVYGVEGSLSFLDDDDLTDYLGSIRGRLGVAFDKTLVYATGGVAFLGYEDDLADALEDDPAIGFVVGAGVEHKLTNNISIGLEGLYYDVSTEFDTDEFDGVDLDLDRNLWTIQARLNYHFNSGYEAPLK